MRSWLNRLALIGLLLAPSSVLAQGRIDQLGAGSAVSNTDSIPNCQGCNSSTAAVKTTFSQVLTWIEANLSTALDVAIGNTQGGMVFRGVGAWTYLPPGSNGQVLRTQGSSADPAWAGLSALFDLTFGSTQGGVLYRNAGAWTYLAPGTNGQFLQTQGAAANVQWVTPAGAGTVTSVALAPGLAKTAGTRNTGSDAITTSGTIIPQLFPVTKAASYVVNADNGGVSDSGAFLIATGGSVTFTLPNPASGSKGNSYQFGSDGTNGFTLTTVGGTATVYGYSGGGAASVAFPSNRDVACQDDGTNYKCTVVASPIIPVSLTWAPGINPSNLPIGNIKEGAIIVGIRCTPEVLAGGAATIQPVKAASGTAVSAGTNLTSSTCNANSGAATDQDLTMSVTALAAGDRLGIKTTGTTIWTSSGVAAGVITFFLR